MDAKADESGREYERAIDDPVKLARAARIVRTALARRRLRLDELAKQQHHADGSEDFCTITGCEVCP